MNTVREIKDQINDLQFDIADYKKGIAEKQAEIDSFEIDSDTVIDQYDQMLDDLYGEFMGYLPSDILKSVDPIAYRCGLVDYVDSLDISEDPNYQELIEELEDLESDLENAENQVEELLEELAELIDGD